MSSDPAGWPEGVARHLLGTVDSTMAEAARRAQDTAGPAWFLARAQAAGHGRRGRPWHHAPGNLAATLLLPLGGDADPAAASLRSFVAALALHDALLPLAPGAALAIKWPNDVLLEGGKVAGILLESIAHRGRLTHLAIGVGVNLAEAPPVAALEPGAVPPVALAAVAGCAPAPEAFLTALAAAFAAREAQLRAAGFGAIRTAWLARAARLGAPLTARLSERDHTGTFETIDETGAMILRTAGGPMRIAAADIFF